MFSGKDSSDVRLYFDDLQLLAFVPEKAILKVLCFRINYWTVFVYLLILILFCIVATILLVPHLYNNSNRLLIIIIYNNKEFYQR